MIVKAGVPLAILSPDEAKRLASDILSRVDQTSEPHTVSEPDGLEGF